MEETPSSEGRASAGRGGKAVWRIGCVSFLNAKPLIDGFEGLADPQVEYAVPSRLLGLLQSGEVDISLCPVIDYFRSEVPLEIVPVGGIGCEGPTLTVRLFSQIAVKHIDTVFADTDSHTSVALMQVLLQQRHGVRPKVHDYDTRKELLNYRLADTPDAMLLIGDKVVTDAPPADCYPYQEDLGEAWHDMTGLPFVFAAWMAREGANLGQLPEVLDRQRLVNANRIDDIVGRHAEVHGWPLDLARLYLGKLLRYQIGPDQIEAIDRFGQMAHHLGLIPHRRTIRLRQ